MNDDQERTTATWPEYVRAVCELHSIIRKAYLDSIMPKPKQRPSSDDQKT